MSSKLCKRAVLFFMSAIFAFSVRAVAQVTSGVAGSRPAAVEASVLAGAPPSWPAQPSDGTQMIFAPNKEVGGVKTLGVTLLPTEEKHWFSGHREASFEYWNPVPAAGLADSIVKMIMTPKDPAKREATGVSIKVENWDDPSQSFTVIARRGDLYWGSKGVYASVTYGEDIMFDHAGWTKIEGTGAGAANKDKAHWDGAQGTYAECKFFTGEGYTDKGAFPLGTWEKDISGIFEGSSEFPITPLHFALHGTELKTYTKNQAEGGTDNEGNPVTMKKMADFKDDDFQTLSVNKLGNDGTDKALKDKYTDEYADALAGMENARISLHFYDVSEAGVNFSIIKMGDTVFDKIGAYDSGKPIGEKKADSVSVRLNHDIAVAIEAVVSFKDDFTAAGDLTVSAAIYKDAGKTQETTLEAAKAEAGIYYASVTATDAAGNVSDSIDLTVEVTDAYQPPAGEIRAEIQVEPITLPTFQEIIGGELAGGDTCTVALYAREDSDFSDPLPLNQTPTNSYTFADTGEYVLRYTVDFAAEGVPDKSYDKPFTIVDTTAPEMTFDGEYEKRYDKGHVLELLIPTLTDNNPAEDNLTKTLTYQIDGGDAVLVTGTTLELSEAGIYTLTYTVTDKAGEFVTKEFELRVRETMPKSVSAEISNAPVHFPPLGQLLPGETFQADLFAADDTEFQTPLNSGNESFYAFSDTGSYVLRYTVYDKDLKVDVYDVDFEVTDTTPPVMHFAEEYEDVYFAGRKLKLLIPELTDNNPAGNPSYEIKYAFGDGALTAISDTELLLDKIGTYTLVYIAKDKNEKNISVTFRFVTEQAPDTEKPRIELIGSYPENAKIGDKLTILAAMVTDNSGENITAEVSVTFAGEQVTIANGVVTFDKEGKYLITYTATDSAGNPAATLSFEIIVTSDKGLSVGAIVGIAVASAVVLAAAAIGIWFAVKKRRA